MSPNLTGISNKNACLTATARRLVLKTMGTVKGMGIDTSDRRQNGSVGQKRGRQTVNLLRKIHRWCNSILIHHNRQVKETGKPVCLRNRRLWVRLPPCRPIPGWCNSSMTVSKTVRTGCKSLPGCQLSPISSAWPECLIWDQDVIGSNPI